MMRTWMAIAALFFAGPALAQFKADPIDEAAAKREGKVTWYTSTPVAAGQFIANAFERRTGIKVEMLRTGGQNVIRRFMQEAEAGRITVDMITMSDMSAANLMTKKGYFVPFKPDGFDKVIPSAKETNGNYIAQRLTLVGMVVRTDKVASAERPRQWTDLTNPKYKGKLVMADPSFTAIQLMVVATLSKKFGWSFYEGLRKNDTLIVQGHEQVFDMLKRGERVIAAESADPRVYTEGKPPENMDTIFSPDGSMIVPSPSAVIKGSPHPNAAKLFAQFNMSAEVQKKLSEDGRPSPRTDVPAPEGMPRLDQIALFDIDYDYIEANTRQLKAKFAEIFQ
jgi:iron(III) transport system substrate-binding protein